MPGIRNVAASPGPAQAGPHGLAGPVPSAVPATADDVQLIRASAMQSRLHATPTTAAAPLVTRGEEQQ
jgi:hypothetical protein